MSLLSLTASAQNNDRLTLSGSIQTDMLIPQNDSVIGAEKDGDFLTNTYVDLKLQHRYFEAGARLEYLEHPLPGFESDFKGWGVPHFYVKGRLGNTASDKPSAELTAGLRDDITLILGSDYGTVQSLSPRVNGRYVFWRQQHKQWVSELSVHAGWGKSVKLPSFQVLYIQKQGPFLRHNWKQ